MKTEQQLIEDMQDLIAKIEREDGYAQKESMAQLVEEYLDEFDGSKLDLFLVAKRMGEVADNLMTTDIKESARAEFILHYGNSKNSHRGISITPVESHARYEYPQDQMLAQYEEDLKDVKKRMKPLEKELNSVKDSIKERQSDLVDEGKATKVGSSKYLKVYS